MVIAAFAVREGLETWEGEEPDDEAGKTKENRITGERAQPGRLRLPRWEEGR
jgi:hypothetical protein